MLLCQYAPQTPGPPLVFWSFEVAKYTCHMRQGVCWGPQCDPVAQIFPSTASPISPRSRHPWCFSNSHKLISDSDVQLIWVFQYWIGSIYFGFLKLCLSRPSKEPRDHSLGGHCYFYWPASGIVFFRLIVSGLGNAFFGFCFCFVGRHFFGLFSNFLV